MTVTPTSAAGARRRGRVALVLLAVVTAMYLLLPLLSSNEAVRRRVERAAGTASGKDVRIERLHLGYDLGAHFYNLSIREPDSEPFLTVDHAVVRVSPRGLFSGQPLTLELVTPRIVADRLPGSGNGVGAPTLPFRSVQIDDGYLVVGDGTDPLGPITTVIDAIHREQEAHVSLRIDPDLPPLALVATLATTAGKVSVAALRLDWHEVSLAGLARRFPVITSGAVEGTFDVSATASGGLDYLKGSGSILARGLRYRSQALDIAGEVDLPFTWQGNRITLQQPGPRIEAVQWTAGSLTGTAGTATLAGTLTLDGTTLHGTGQLVANKIRAHDPTSERVLEGLAVAATVDGRWSTTTPATLSVGLSTANGEVLWDGIYADLSRHPSKLTCDVTGSELGIDLSNINARAAGIGALTGRLQLSSVAAVQQANLEIEVGELDSLYTLALRDPYKESYPLLATTSVGGALRARVEYKDKGPDFSLTGNLRLMDASISATAPGFSVQGIDLDIPLQLGKVRDLALQEGKLRIRNLRFGAVDAGEVAAALTVRADGVELAAPVSMHLLGGTLQLSELGVAEITSGQPHASLGVTVQALELGPLTKALGLPSLPGTMSGAIPRITVATDEVRSEGEIRIQAFDGNLAVRNLSIDQLFSPVPTFGLDLDFHDISLGRLTETLEIGRVSGVAHGEIRHLAIVNRQPLSFDAWMETVERAGVAQRISVSAIRQLSILGGSGGDPFSQGLLSFFDEYRYAKMGFKCSLENDRFQLRGVETIAGKEYLVVGSRMPPSVNVVSHTQVISFSEMVQRLQRVTSVRAPEQDEGEQE